MWQLKLCSGLQLGKVSVNNSYAIKGVILSLVKNMSDLGITIDNNFDFKLHVNKICVQAKQRASLIPRCFYTRDKYFLFKAFTTYVRPLVEYCCSVSSPYQCTLIDKLESNQCNFTKKLFGLEHLTYIDRLRVINTDTLEIRRLKVDLLFYYKIFHKLVDLKEVDFFVRKNSNTIWS